MLRDILDNDGIKKAAYSLDHLGYKDFCLFAIEVAELALQIFEEEYPNDLRVRNCIQAAKDHKSGKITTVKLESFREEAMSAWEDVCEDMYSVRRPAGYAAGCAVAAADVNGKPGISHVVCVAEASGVTLDQIETIFRKHFIKEVP